MMNKRVWWLGLVVLVGLGVVVGYSAPRGASQGELALAPTLAPWEAVHSDSYAPDPVEAEARRQEQLKQEGTVVGRVMRPDGQPLAEAGYDCVPLFPLERTEGGKLTSSQGKFVCGGPPGRYEIRIGVPGLQAIQQVELAAGQTLTVTLVVRPITPGPPPSNTAIVPYGP